MRGLPVSARKHTFDGVPADIAEYCLRLGQPVSAKRGDILVRQGARASRCFYVRHGYAKVTSTSLDGHQILLGFVGPKDLVGQSAVTPDLETYGAEAARERPDRGRRSSREARRDRCNHRPTRDTRRSREFHRQQSLHGQPRPGAAGETGGLIVSRRGRLRLLNVPRLKSLAREPSSLQTADRCASAKTTRNVSR
jgi:hypothetical protein